VRITRIVAKELKCVREDPSFNFVTVLSPLLFLFAFWLMLSGGITLPVQVYPSPQTSDFLTAMENHKSPDGTPYMELQPAAEAVPPTNAESDLVVIDREPSSENDAITGKIVHYINDVNENMTKNFRNRISGALVSYIDSLRDGGNVRVAETTVYDRDIPWDTGFGVSVFVFGLVLSGLLFGMLSITSEWENKTTKLLKLSPYPAGIAITGKMLANIIKCFVSGLLYLLIFFLLSHTLPVHSLPFAAALLLVYGIFVCLGMCVGIYIKATLTAFLISLVTALTLWVGGGGFGPLSYFGDIANVLGSINPATYAIELIRWCYFNGNADLTAGFSFLGIAFAVVFVLIVVVYTKWVRSEEAGR
jgi:ABC-2 type transport system permease protein